MPRLDPMVPVALPNEYVNVCVNALEARFIVIVTSEPKLTDDDDKVGCVARGIVVSTLLADFVSVPIDKFVENDAYTDNVFVPSVL